MQNSLEIIVILQKKKKKNSICMKKRKKKTEKEWDEIKIGMRKFLVWWGGQHELFGWEIIIIKVSDKTQKQGKRSYLLCV